jgi:hypothetical protein
MRRAVRLVGLSFGARSKSPRGCRCTECLMNSRRRIASSQAQETASYRLGRVLWYGLKEPSKRLSQRTANAAHGSKPAFALRSGKIQCLSFVAHSGHNVGAR